MPNIKALDLTIDGADEVELGTLDLIKGLGGALLREKIVAAASRRLVIVVDQEKLVERLGEHTPVPVEVTQFGWQATAVALAKLGCIPERRYTAGEQPYVTDGGNYILDCRFGPLADPGEVERSIAMTVGTVESGLFVGRSSMVVVASPTGVEVLTPPARAASVAKKRPPARAASVLIRNDQRPDIAARCAGAAVMNPTKARPDRSWQGTVDGVPDP